MVELSDAVSEVEGVVVGQAGDASAELDVPGHSEGLSDEQLWGGDVLPGGGEVLSYPCLGVPQLVEGDDLVEVVVNGLREVAPRWVERIDKVAYMHR